MSLAEILTPNNDTIYCANAFIGGTGPTGMVGGYTYNVLNVGLTGCLDNNSYVTNFHIARNNNTVTVTFPTFSGGATGTSTRGTIQTIGTVLNPRDLPVNDKTAFVYMTSNNVAQNGMIQVRSTGLIVFSLGVTSGLQIASFFTGSTNGWVSASITYVI
jgi:hypothetical protein